MRNEFSQWHKQPKLLHWPTWASDRWITIIIIHLYAADSTQSKHIIQRYSTPYTIL